MTLRAGTIDLGELPRDGQPELDAAGPVLARLRRWHGYDRRRTGRLAGAAGVTALVLAVTGAAAQPRPAFEPHLTIPAVTGFDRDEQRLYVVQAPEPGRTRLVAYRLADGTVGWQVPLPDGEHAGLTRWRGVLLVHAFGESTSVTIALDPGTGRELWRRSGGRSLETITGGRLLFGDFRFTPRLDRGGPPERRFTAVDPATGRTAWTAPVTAVNYTAGFPDSTYLVAYDHDGGLNSYDLTTGERLARTTVSPADFHSVQVVGSLALLMDRWQPALTAYDVHTLTPLWTTGELGGGEIWPTGCGELLCLVGQYPPQALDPATGELVWSADWLPTGDNRITISGSGLAAARLDGYLLVTEYPRERSWLIDAGTGEPVLDLRDWRLTQSWPPAAATGPEPRLVRHGEAGALIGALRPDLSGVRLLGQVDAPPGSSCTAWDEYVYCLAERASGEQPQELAVWRHRLP